MGCSNSKQSRCRHCRNIYAPLPRSYSVQVRHPSQGEGYRCHVVALKSTTLGALKVEKTTAQNLQHRPVMCDEASDKWDEKQDFENGDHGDKKRVEFSMEIIEAKTWSRMIEDKIPRFVSRTPIRTPPGEPETINAWEFMEGLEDTSPLRSFNHHRSFSFGVIRHQIQDPLYRPNSVLQENGIESPKPVGFSTVNNGLSSMMRQNGSKSPKPTWLQMLKYDSNLKPDISDFDPDTISTFSLSLENLSSPKKTDDFTMEYKRPKQWCDKVVIYFTSLRGVRKTYKDCCHVRVIMKGLGVRVDERDVSMHLGFKDELKELLGDKLNGAGLNLPRVFVGRKYIGGAEEIKKLHEDGQLGKLLEPAKRSVMMIL